MEKIKLINARKKIGISLKEMADLLKMEDYSYRRRENGETKITYKEWQKMAEILKVEVDDIFESDNSLINIHNENGQVNASSNLQKIQYYNIPKEMIDSQQEYINLLKEQIVLLQNEIEQLKRLKL